MLEIAAPAKLNLTLEVLGRRKDGFHEIRSIVQTINLGDYLSFQPGETVKITSDTPGWKPERSLVCRAAHLLKETTGYTKGAKIAVEKYIPLTSGLGGDSSNAAATLAGLNRLWNLNLPAGEISRLAQQLGSDVPFFLCGGTALVEGRGERVTPLPPPPRMWVVLIVPPVPRMPDKTGTLYRSLKASHYTDGSITQRLVDALQTGGKFTPEMLFNTFENVAFKQFGGLDAYRRHIEKLGAPHLHLAGSGPALFTLLKDKSEAADLYTRIKQPGIECYLTSTGTGKLDE